MRYLAVLATIVAYALAVASVCLVSFMKLETWRMVAPLICMTLAMFLWAFLVAASIVLMVRCSPKSENFYVYLLNVTFNAAPLLYFFYQMMRYPGPRTQFLFEWFTRGTTHLLDH